MGKGSFSQFDLTNLQDSVEGVGKAILDRQMREQAQKDKAATAAQKEIENQMKQRQTDQADQFRKDTLEQNAAYKQGQLNNTAERNAQLQQQAIDKLKAGTAAAAATGEKNSNLFLQKSRENLSRMVKDGTLSPEQASAADNAMLTQGDPEFLGHLKKSGVQPLAFTAPPAKMGTADGTAPATKAINDANLKLAQAAMVRSEGGPDAEQRAAQLENDAQLIKKNIIDHSVQPPKTTVSVGSQDANGNMVTERLTADQYQARQDQQKLKQKAGEDPALIRAMRAQVEGGAQSQAAPVKQPLAPAAQAQSGARVKVQDKNGKQFTVPASQLEQAKKQGYTPVE